MQGSWFSKEACFEQGIVERDWVLLISSIYMMYFPFKTFLLLFFPLSLTFPDEASWRRVISLQKRQPREVM